MITFTVPCTPVAQPRHRIGRIGGFARAYISKGHAVHSFKEAVRVCCQKNYFGELITDPVIVRAVFVMDRPKKYNAKKYSPGRLWYDRQPDIDNFEKSLYDAMTGLIWKNDSQVCDSRSQKYYAAVDEHPHVEVCVQIIQ